VIERRAGRCIRRRTIKPKVMKRLKIEYFSDESNYECDDNENNVVNEIWAKECSIDKESCVPDDNDWFLNV
jgi:hypothetical protein